MLSKLLKLNANDAIISGATTMRSSGSVTRRKTCHAPPPSTRAASTSSAGIDCSAPSETRKKYGNVSQTLTRMHRDLRPVGVEEPRHVQVEQLVDDAEVVVQEARARRGATRKPGIAYGMTSSDAVDALEAHARLVEHDREEEARARTRSARSSAAKTNVQTKTRRNGSRISGSCEDAR